MSYTFTSNTRFTMNSSVLNHLLNDPQGEVGEYLEKRAQVVVAAARAQVGVKTGALRDSFEIVHNRTGRSQSVTIVANNNIAWMHHEGTRPHDIHAKEPGMMRFQSRGRTVYAKHVLHPGTKPNKFLSDNLHLAIL